jgi:hypothetical protein
MTISYQTPVPISLSSQNGSLVLSGKNPQNFYSFRLLFFNSTVNVTIKYYDINGKLVNTVTYTTPESISVKNGDYSLITWNDANNYQVQGWYQEIIPSSQEDIAKLITEFDLNAVPIGQVNINSPLDNGYVAVKTESGSVVSTDLLRKSTVLVNAIAITANTTFTYTPLKNKISVLIHITAVSGTSPTLVINGYAIDPNGNVLSGDAIFTSSTYTSTGDQFINVDLYGVNALQIALTVGGTSPSFTMTLSVVE